MIRLIASDLDGTLLQNGAQALTVEAFQLIAQVQKLGIRFVAASGRQYANMKRLFGPVWRDIIFIAENGSLIVEQDAVLEKTVIPPFLAKNLTEYLYSQDCCDVMVSGVHSVYLQPKPQTKPILDHILFGLKNTTTIVDDIGVFSEEVLKISAIVYGDKVHEFGAKMIQKWSHQLNVAVAGEVWLDFTPSNKGEAINKLRVKLGMEQEELVAFGDNYNDASMFQSVGYSYAMLGAKDEVQQMARYSCGSVETVLKNLIAYYR